MSNDGSQDQDKKPLSLDTLDKVVGGVSTAPSLTKNKTLDPDLLTGAHAGVGFSPIDFSGG